MLAQSFRSWRRLALVAVLGLAPGLPAVAQETVESPHHLKLDDAVHDALRAGRGVRAVVRFSDDAARQRGWQTVLGHGGRVRRTLDQAVGLSIVADAATIDSLAIDPGVARISIDAIVRPTAVSRADLGSPRSSGVGAARRQSGRRGRGTAVAVIDSGVQPHADLPASRIRAFVDFVNGRTTPYDDYGHGTHVAGVIAGSGAASATLPQPFIGAAPSVDIVALKVLDGAGAGRTSDVVAALEWVLANYQAYNIRVVNLSLGHPVFEPAATDPLVQAAESLTRRGVVVVASAGNLGVDPKTGRVGYGGVTSPANGPSVIAVGAVDDKGTDARGDDTVTDYSSRGPTRFDLRAKPDLVAPGHKAVSLAAPDSFLFTNYPQLQVYGGAESVAAYFRLSGTSMAAPVVAGAAALVLDANPRLPAATVKMVLEFTAQQLPGADRLTQGAGYVNALGAVRLAMLVNPRAPRGTYWLRQPVVPVASDELFGERIVWARNIVWGQRVLEGDAGYIHLRAWDDNIVWGQGDNIVWGQGDNIVWGQTLDNIVWGQDNIVWGQHLGWAASYDLLDNIVWGQVSVPDNIVWGQDNIVWGQDDLARAYWGDNIVWGFADDNIVWGQVARQTLDNIVWGQDWLDNIVWGQDDNIVWGQAVLTEGSF